MTPADRWLARAIRANAAILLLAAVPIFFPTDWMAESNERLGLGLFVRNPLTEYLTRSAAACYSLHGVVLLLLSLDVPRYRPMIRWIYYSHLTFAAKLLGIDLVAGMPAWWIFAEVGTISTVAVGILVLNRRAAQVSSSSAF